MALGETSLSQMRLGLNPFFPCKQWIESPYRLKMEDEATRRLLSDLGFCAVLGDTFQTSSSSQSFLEGRNS